MITSTHWTDFNKHVPQSIACLLSLWYLFLMPLYPCGASSLGNRRCAPPCNQFPNAPSSWYLVWHDQIPPSMASSSPMRGVSAASIPSALAIKLHSVPAVLLL